MTQFESRVYKIICKIPRGFVTTYGDVAKQLGGIKYSRAVGNALHNNEDPDTIPCFKVVNSQGKLAINFGDGGIAGQKRRLENDGIEVVDGKVDLEKYRFEF